MFDFLKSGKKDDNAKKEDQTKDGRSSPGKAVTDTASEAVSELMGAVTGAVSPADGKYTVKAGDSLSKIAKKHNVTLKQIIAANPQIKNPDLIHPGDVVRLG